MNIKRWEPSNFNPETNTVWSFPKRGDWATHDAKYRGNWSPYIPRNLLLRYSVEGDTVLDQFVGGGTTLVEAKLLNRNVIAVDINPAVIDRCREKSDFNWPNAATIQIKLGDARNLNFLENNRVDFICTHPPYADIICYSDGIEGDLSNYSVSDFLIQMQPVALECHRVLKYGKFCAILMGDMRKNGCVVPLAFNVMKLFESVGFRLKEIIIKQQHNCKATGFWKTKSQKYNFLLLAHEYIFVYKKVSTTD